MRQTHTPGLHTALTQTRRHAVLVARVMMYSMTSSLVEQNEDILLVCVVTSHPQGPSLSLLAVTNDLTVTVTRLGKCKSNDRTNLRWAGCAPEAKWVGRKRKSRCS